MTPYEVIIACTAVTSAALLIIQVRLAIRSLKADHERRRKQATIEHVGLVWRDTLKSLETEWGFTRFSQETIQTIRSDAAKEAKVRYLLGVFEDLATGLHTGVYDKDTFYRMAATSCIRTYHRLLPYIELIRHDYPTMFVELKRLAEEFERRKSTELKEIANMSRF